MKTALQTFFFLTLTFIISLSTMAQCTTGTYVVTSSSNTSANFNVNSGETLFIASGSFTGTVNLSGGAICIAGGAVFTPGSFNINGSGTINNYGRAIFGGLNLSNGFVVNNYDSMSITGNLNWNGTATFTNAKNARIGFSQPFDLKLSSTFTNNGTLWSRGNFTTESGTTFNNNSRLMITGQFNPSGYVNNWGLVVASDFININNGNKTINYCRFVSQMGFNNNDPDTENRGLIWVTRTPSGSDNFVVQNNANLINTGYIRSKSFLNNGVTLTNTGGSVVVEGAASGTYSKNQGTITGGTVGDKTNAAASPAYGFDTNIGTITASFSNIALLDTTSDQYVTMCSSYYSSYKVSGYVWKDNGTTNGVKDGAETNYLDGGLYAILINSTNTVIASAAVSTTDGSYTITGVPPTTTGLKIIITSTAGTVGASAPSASAPAGYSITGESNNGSAEYPGDGSIELPSTNADLINRSFGIKPVITYVPVSGYVWIDSDGNGIKGTSENFYTAGNLYAVLLDAAGNAVESAIVNSADGSYTLTQLPTSVSGYKVVLSNTAVTIGNAVTASAPSGYYFTAENINGTIETPGDGSVSLSASASAVANQRFGIQQPAVAEVKSFVLDKNSSYVIPVTIVNTVNSGVTFAKKILMSGSSASGNMPSQLTGADPEGGSLTLIVNPATYAAMRSGNSSPYSVMLLYNGVQLQAGGCKGANVGDGLCSYYNAVNGYWEIPNFDASKLSVLMEENVSQLSFAYAWKDAASQIGSFSTYSVKFSTVLPLKLISFNAAVTAGGQNLLSWKTADEDNTSYFAVERSRDGLTFTFLGNVKAVGAGNGNYTFTDTHPLSGDNYYRLRMVDVDEKFSLSAVAVVRGNTLQDAGIRIHANPVKNNQIVVSWKEAAPQGQIEIYNAAGALMYKGSFSNTAVTIPATGWAPGVYQVKAMRMGMVYMKKVIIP